MASSAVAAVLSVRRILLLLLNIATTILTLLTGLSENPFLLFVTRRYDAMRGRFVSGRINYNQLAQDEMDTGMLPDLEDIGENWRFFTEPDRNPSTVGSDRSTCLRTNSMNVTFLSVHFQDFWGTGPRRAQIFVWSISPPRCDIVNLKPAWYNQSCVYGPTIGNGNGSVCHQYILDNFETLRENRQIRVGVEADFGTPGVPFLKCRGRPLREFNFWTDLMVMQAYWTGGKMRGVQLQTSACIAKPLQRTANWDWTLFRVAAADKGAQVLETIDSTAWISQAISIIYGLVTLIMILRGVYTAVVRSRVVEYLPEAERFRNEARWLKITFPFVPVLSAVNSRGRAIHFEGALLVASDVWMNHWLYIALSMLEAAMTIRSTYVVFSAGIWYLTLQVNMTNFVFTCAALSRMAWLMCLIHSVLRGIIKLLLRGLKKSRFMRASVRHQLEWYIDAVSLFASYKIYSLVLCLTLYLMLKIHGSTTFMKRPAWSKRGVYGGAENISGFWGSEIMCDMVVYTLLVIPSVWVLCSLLLLTRYRKVANNRVVQLLQQRYVLVGWDIFSALSALGIDPYDRMRNDDDGICRTQCSLGALLQQLYTSGVSGYVTLAGDFVFVDKGFSKAPPQLRYPIKTAIEMRLCERSNDSSSKSRYATLGGQTAQTGDRDSALHSTQVRPAPSMGIATDDTSRTKSGSAVSLFDRDLKLVTEGYMGKILLIDEMFPGKVVQGATGMSEFEVQDSLSMLSIGDIKSLLGQGSLHIR